jgi:hypothetical protein
MFIRNSANKNLFGKVLESVGKNVVSPESVLYTHFNLIDLEEAQIMSP